MWKKLILSLVLVTFVGHHIVNGLTCYTCNSPSSCQNPSTQLCTAEAANTTSSWLSAFHSNVPSVDNTVYKCMNLTYFFYANNTKIKEILGCFHDGIYVCSLQLNATDSSTWAKNCRTCGYDNCNRSPAAALNKSPFLIAGSVVALLLAKLVV